MRQLTFNQFEKIASNDYNSLQLLMHKSLFDDTLYNLFQKQSGALLGAFAPSYTSALVGSLAAGTAFWYDASQTGFNPNYRMVKANAVVPLAFAAADPVNDRIDLVCLAPNFTVTGTVQRYVKAGGTGPVALVTIPKVSEDLYTLQIVTGVPGAVPVVPAVPAGFFAATQVYIHANVGMTGLADMTNLLTPLTVPAVGTAYQRWVSSAGLGTDTTIAAAIAALGAGGGKIYIMDNIALGAATIAASVANLEFEGFPGATISGTGTCFTVTAAGVRISKIRMSGFATGVAIGNGNNNCFVTENRFAGCTNDVVDSNATPNNVITNNISE